MKILFILLDFLDFILYTRFIATIPGAVYGIHRSNVWCTSDQCMVYIGFGTAVPGAVYGVHWSRAWYTLEQCMVYTGIGTAVPRAVYGIHWLGNSGYIPKNDCRAVYNKIKIRLISVTISIESISISCFVWHIIQE